MREFREERESDETTEEDKGSSRDDVLNSSRGYMKDSCRWEKTVQTVIDDPEVIRKYDEDEEAEMSGVDAGGSLPEDSIAVLISEEQKDTPKGGIGPSHVKSATLAQIAEEDRFSSDKLNADGMPSGLAFNSARSNVSSVKRAQNVLVMELLACGKREMKEMRVRDLVRYIQSVTRRVHHLSKSRASMDYIADQALTHVLRETRYERRMSVTGSSRHAGTGGVLNARDIRRLISGMYNWSDMTFAVRRNVILMHLDALRCILLYDRLIVLVPDGADQLLHDLENKITEAKTQQTVFFGTGEGRQTPFEFLAIEAVLGTVLGLLKKDMDALVPKVEKNLRQLQGSKALNTEQQDTLRHHKVEVSKYEAKVRSFYKELEEVLEEDQDLNMMHLTKIQHDGEVEEDMEHDEAEILLESYMQDSEELIKKWDLLKKSMESTENYILMRIDMARNKLLTAGVILAVINLCFAYASAVTGVFGMNLYNGISDTSGSLESNSAFNTIVISIACFFMVFGVGSLYYMYRTKTLVN